MKEVRLYLFILFLFFLQETGIAKNYFYWGVITPINELINLIGG